MHGFAPEKRAFFVEAMGEERVADLEEKLFGLSKELEARGVRFKEVIEHVENRLMTEVKKVVSPARLFINDLLGRQRPAESKAAKALRESRRPGADFAADVLDGRVVRG